MNEALWNQLNLAAGNLNRAASKASELNKPELASQLMEIIDQLIDMVREESR